MQQISFLTLAWRTSPFYAYSPALVNIGQETFWLTWRPELLLLDARSADCVQGTSAWHDGRPSGARLVS